MYSEINEIYRSFGKYFDMKTRKVKQIENYIFIFYHERQINLAIMSKQKQTLSEIGY